MTQHILRWKDIKYAALMGNKAFDIFVYSEKSRKVMSTITPTGLIFEYLRHNQIKAHEIVSKPVLARLAKWRRQ